MNTIVLEGVDGSGKSTLAAALEKLGYKVVHFGVPPKSAQRSEEAIFNFFMKPLYNLTQAGKPVVLDRLHLSDRIYGPVMRGHSPLTLRAELLIERYLEA